jgi:hypothetical protein
MNSPCYMISKFAAHPPEGNEPMPWYYGQVREVTGERPDQGLPPSGGPIDPDYGVDVGGRPSHDLPPLPGAPDNSLPPPPPGVWPPLTPANPIEPAPPGTPPGAIWPPPGTPEHPIAPGVFYVIAGIPGIGWRYVAVDPSLQPSPS